MVGFRGSGLWGWRYVWAACLGVVSMCLEVSSCCWSIVLCLWVCSCKMRSPLWVCWRILWLRWLAGFLGWVLVFFKDQKVSKLCPEWCWQLSGGYQVVAAKCGTIHSLGMLTFSPKVWWKNTYWLFAFTIFAAIKCIIHALTSGTYENNGLGFLEQSSFRGGWNS